MHRVQDLRFDRELPKAEWLEVFEASLLEADDDRSTDLLFDKFCDLLCDGQVVEAESLLAAIAPLELNANVREAVRIVASWTRRARRVL